MRRTRLSTRNQRLALAIVHAAKVVDAVIYFATLGRWTGELAEHALFRSPLVERLEES